MIVFFHTTIFIISNHDNYVNYDLIKIDFEILPSKSEKPIKNGQDIEFNIFNTVYNC